MTGFDFDKWMAATEAEINNKRRMSIYTYLGVAFIIVLIYIAFSVFILRKISTDNDNAIP